MESNMDKTMNQKETEAILAMGKKIEQLEQLVAEQKKRIADLEDLLKHK